MKRKQSLFLVGPLINEARICGRAGGSSKIHRFENSPWRSVVVTGAASRAPTKDGSVSLVMRTLMAVCAAIVGMSVLLVSMPAEANDASPTEALVNSNTAFALHLYGQLRGQEGNLFLSPYSISTALAMTYAGARENTEKQMAQVLHFTLPQDQLHPAFASMEAALKAIQEKGDIELRVANALWPQKDYVFLEEFLALIGKYYGSAITPLDYKTAHEAARRTINEWVEKKTNDKIKDLIPEGVLDAFTRLVLTNAIYFKGNWATQFDKKLTEDAPFHLLSGDSVETPLMHQKQTCGYAEFEGLQVLELPYVGDALSMVLLLPREVDGLAELEHRLTTDNLEKWTGQLGKQQVSIFLPKFTMTSQFQLEKTLGSMGMPDAFGSRADFSGMDGTRNLFISAVIHKAFVAVDEEGTEAAAATGVVISLTAAPRPTPVFRADHPFVFIIRDNASGSILFLGRVVDPTAK
jgi:serpin B